MKLVSLSLCLATVLCAENRIQHGPTRAVEQNTLGCYQGKLAAPLDTCYGLYLEVDALYWIPHEEGLEFAFKQNSGSASTDTSNPQTLAATVNGSFNRIDFDWQAAFRLEGGYKLPIDDWRVFARWTRLNEDAEGHATAQSITTQTLAAIWLGAEFFSEGYLRARDAKAKWNLHYNVVDAGIGRTFNWGSRLQLTPQTGIRGFWVNQRFSVNYAGGDLTAPANFKGINNFDGAGIFGQINSQWFFARQWAVVAEFLGSVNFGRLRLAQQTLSQIQLTSVFPLRNVIHEVIYRTRFAYQAAVGLEWSTYLGACSDKKIGFSVLYELSEWIHMNQLRRFVYSDFAAVANFIPLEGDLGFQGISITGRFDY